MKGLLQDAILAQAERAPERAAIVAGSTRLSYGELARQSAQLAHQLRAAGCAPGDRVGILMSKSPAAYVAILGTLQASCIYVPMDPASPAPRLAKIVAACAPKVVLVTRETQALAREASAAQLGTLESLDGCAFTARDLAAFRATQPACSARAEDPAHILFTSGSTGTPKGVVIPHATVLSFLAWAIPHFGIDASDRCSAHPPLHFDLSTFDLYGTLGQGAELHLVPAETSLLPHKLVEFMRTARLTQWFSVPSILSYLTKFDVLEQRDLPDLRRVLWCGEVLPTPTLIDWMRRVPQARFTNLYGPTEATIASTFYDVPRIPEDPQAPIPIGRACAGEEALVLDEQMREVMDGEIGELHLGGAGLSPGYWQDPAKTQGAFVRDPRDPARRLYKTGDLCRRDASGVLHFVGRKDTQIKSRGYRIELGEIEAALATLAPLRESAVVAIPTDGFEGWTICCALAPHAGQRTTPAQVRKDLARLVPGYMLPSRWLVLDQLPKNQNGKIDRPRLRQTFAEAVDSGASNA